MLRLIQTLMKTLHTQWRTMGSSSFMAIIVLMGVAYLILSLQLLLEFIRSRINRGLTKYDDVRAIQSWDKAPPPPRIEVNIPQEFPFRARVGQTRTTVKRYRLETEQRVDQRIGSLRKRVVSRRIQHA